MARPRIEIDKKQFEKLCGLQCTKEDIAGFFDVSEDTIDRFCKREYKESFAVVFSKKRRIGLALTWRERMPLCISSMRRTSWE